MAHNRLGQNGTILWRISNIGQPLYKLQLKSLPEVLLSTRSFEDTDHALNLSLTLEFLSNKALTLINFENVVFFDKQNNVRSRFQHELFKIE